MNNRFTPVLLAAVILAAIIITYSNHFGNTFHFDDSHTVQDNGFIRELSNIPLFFRDVTTSSSMPTHQGYRPMVTTTLAIDYWLSMKITGGKDGYNMFSYHLSNFSWFVLIVILLYFIQLSLYNYAFSNPNNKYFALLGCAWYGLLTPNAETVNYIISRSDILSTLGIVGSLALYVYFEKARKYYLYLIPAILGMFAKETTIMFAPALIAYDYMIAQEKSLVDIFTLKEFKTFFRSILKGLPALLICLALAYLGIKMTQVFQTGGSTGIWYIITQPYILLHYVTQFFFPFGLTADTDFPVIVSISDDRLYIGFAFLAALIYLAFRTSASKQWRPFAFGIVWFLLMLLPTSLVPLAEVTNDHRAFLPYIGLIFSMVCLLANLFYYPLKNKLPARAAILGLLIIALTGYAYGTYQRNEVWKTDERLWRDVTEKSPNNGRGWMNYGLTLMGRGDYANAQYTYDQALIHTPRYYILHINIGVLKEATGRRVEAEQYYKNALTYGPNYVESYYYYARYLYKMSRMNEAEIYVNKGLDIFSGHIYSRALLMDIYNYNRDWTKLRAAAETTLAMYPNDEKAKMYLKIALNPQAALSAAQGSKLYASELLNQSLAYYNTGKFRECIDACEKAIALQPNYVEAYNNICSAYNQLRQFDSAAIACKKAIELRPDYQLAKNNLAWALKNIKK